MLVDDELPVLELLERMLASIPDVKITGKYQNPAKALEGMAGLLPDAAFLDIDMPGMNGIELAEKLYEIKPDMEFVFVTAYDQYAIDAFKVNALDYVLKPVTLERIRDSVERVRRRIGKQQFSTAPREGLEAPSAQIHVKMLGSFEVRNKDGRFIHWLTSKVEELFAYLLLRDGAASKWSIMDALWPEADPGKAEQNLYTTVFRLKQTLREQEPGIRIQVDKGTYRLVFNPRDLDMDIRMLQEVALSPKQDIECRMKAFAAYKGELLEGKDYLWCYDMKEEYYGYFLTTALRTAEEYFQRDEPWRGMEILQKVLRLNPEDEKAMALLEKKIGNKDTRQI